MYNEDGTARRDEPERVRKSCSSAGIRGAAARRRNRHVCLVEWLADGREAGVAGVRAAGGAHLTGFFQALEKIGYQDGVSPEPLGRIPKEMTPEEGARLGLEATLKVMRKAKVA